MVKLTEGMVIARTRATDLYSVRKLNCWGSELSDVSLLRQMVNVEVLSLSVNNITTLADFQRCRNLQELYIRKNLIADLSDIWYLKDLAKLRNLWLEDNPCAVGDRYRKTVLKYLPQLQKLDNIVVQPEELQDAAKFGMDLVHPEEKDTLTPSPTDVTPIPAAVVPPPQGHHHPPKHSEIPVLELDLEGNVCPVRETNGTNLTVLSPAEVPQTMDPLEKRAQLPQQSHQQQQQQLKQELIDRHQSDSDHLPDYGSDERVACRNMRNLRSPPYTSDRDPGHQQALYESHHVHLSHQVDLKVMTGAKEREYTEAPQVDPRFAPQWNHPQVPSRMLEVHSDAAEDFQYRMGRDEAPQRYGPPPLSHHNSLTGFVASHHKHRTGTPPLDKLLDSPNKPYPIRPKNRNSNILSAVLCLIKELDYASLEVVEMAIRCRMEELDD